jgi:hypothetical protein
MKIKNILFTFIFIISICIFAPTVYADEEFCIQLSETAELIMLKRQEGVSMRTMLSLVNNSTLTETQRGAMKRLIKEAYASPKFQVKENQRNAAIEFGNKVCEMCLSASK